MPTAAIAASHHVRPSAGSIAGQAIENAIGICDTPANADVERQSRGAVCRDGQRQRTRCRRFLRPPPACACGCISAYAGTGKGGADHVRVIAPPVLRAVGAPSKAMPKRARRTRRGSTQLATRAADGRIGVSRARSAKKRSFGGLVQASRRRTFEVDGRAHGHDARRIDGDVALVVVPLDMVQIYCLANARDLAKLARVCP